MKRDKGNACRLEKGDFTKEIGAVEKYPLHLHPLTQPLRPPAPPPAPATAAYLS